MARANLPLMMLLATLAVAPWAGAQIVNPSSTASVSPSNGPGWAQLTSAQRAALAPLEQDWNTIDAPRKEKWLDIAVRLPRMSPEERARAQERMSEWARLSPQERGQARLRYQQTRQIAPLERQARWEAYQALPAEERNRLAGATVAGKQPATPPRTSPGATKPGETGPKSNIVPTPATLARSKSVAPTMMQGQAGATTSLITRPAAPPTHQQPGMPKIAATPAFVDKTTLLPKSGPQGAAVTRAAVASDEHQHQ